MAICTTPMCTNGGLSVQQMEETFNSLLSNPKFDRSRFESTMLSIKNAYDSSIGWYDPYIPFNPICCSIESLGKQADALTVSMLKSVGSETTTPGPSTSPDEWDFSTLALIAGMTLLIVYSGPIKEALRR